MRLQVTLLLGGKTATGFEVPPEAVESLGSGKRPAVTVTINGYTYRTTIARMGNAYMVPVSAERREAAGIAAGDEIEVDIELDTAPRVVEVPADLAAALAAAPGARATLRRPLLHLPTRTRDRRRGRQGRRDPPAPYREDRRNRHPELTAGPTANRLPPLAVGGRCAKVTGLLS